MPMIFLKGQENRWNEEDPESECSVLTLRRTAGTQQLGWV